MNGQPKLVKTIVDHAKKDNSKTGYFISGPKEALLILKNPRPFRPDVIGLNLKEKLKDLGINEFCHYNAQITFPGIGSEYEVILFNHEEDYHLARLSMLNIIHGERL